MIEEEVARIDSTDEFGIVGLQCFFLTTKPLVFGDKTMGTRRFDGKYAYLVIACDNPQWISAANQSIIAQSQRLCDLNEALKAHDRPVAQAIYLDIKETIEYLNRTPDRSFIVEQDANCTEEVISELLAASNSQKKVVAVFTPFQTSTFSYRLHHRIGLARINPTKVVNVQSRDMNDSDLLSASIVVVPDWLDDGDDFNGEQTNLLKELCVTLGVNYRTNPIHKLCGDTEIGSCFVIRVPKFQG